MPAKSLRPLRAVLALTIAVWPAASFAQAGQPEWVTKIWTDLLKNCNLPASQFGIRLTGDQNALQVEFSPTLRESQKQCIVTAMSYVKQLPVLGLPAIERYPTRATP